MTKPQLSKSSIWNMSMGFFGIQMGFALQNGNASRILLNFGADVHQLSWFWIVAPLTGMIIQPIIGHYSDQTWTKLGRRRPYFLAGAIVASIGLLLLPNAGIFIKYLPAIWVGAFFLMIMDASFNVAMEPFRALVSDMLDSSQRTAGYAIQTVLIGFGAVLGSWLPYFLKNFAGVSGTNSSGVENNVLWSFIIGAILLILTILWTVIKTKEYSPQQIQNFTGEVNQEKKSSILNIFTDLANMPKTMKQLAFVQFFTWFGLFSMWVYSTPAIAQHIYNLPATDTNSEAFNDAGDWVGIIFGVYNLVSAVYAFFLPGIAKRFTRKKTHAISLILGAAGLISIYFVPNKWFLILSMVGVGIAWASILAMPYAILGGSIPAKKMGIYMGIFNLFITVPQILNAILGGAMLKGIFNDKAIYSLLFGGLCFIIAAVFVLFVEDKDEPVF